MAFSDAEKTNIRRYCGYGAYGGGQPLPASGYRFSTRYGAMEYKLNTLSASEEDVVRTNYLANLTTLESAIVASSSNLDTAAAAVWTHNQHEVRDRTKLYNQWRRELCAFLGIPAGPGLGDGSVTLVV